jgi:hypothetical protein
VDVSEINCPKCGAHQESGAECLRCGVIFDRYRPAGRPSDGPAGGDPAAQPGHLDEPAPCRAPVELFGDGSPGGQPSRLSSALSRARPYYRVLRWCVAGVLGAVLILILWTAPPPTVAIDPEAPQRLERKLQRFEADARLGLAPRLRLDAPEVNSWMRTSLALAAEPAPKPAVAPERPASKIDLDSPTNLSIEETRSNVRDVQVRMAGDQITAYVLFNLYGKDLSLTLEGHLSVEAGYLRLSPTRMMLGSLPIPQATVNRAVSSLFDSPENRERFRLPPDIRDLKIEDGELVVTWR